jgi:hypothetical protein
MGLDAFVFCDCFEQGNLKKQPKAEWKVYVSESGGRECNSDLISNQEDFDKWNNSEACEHEEGMATFQSLGNASRVNLIKSILMESNKKLPILMEQVLYSGTHCGDWIDYESVPNLLHEIDMIRDCYIKNNEDKKIILGFEAQMRDLIECSLKLRKPIVF